MKLGATLTLLALLVTPAGAAVIHDESVNGDLSSNAAAPTAVALALGSSRIVGTVSNLAANPGERDFITFTIPAGRKLTALNLIAYSPDNLSFTAFNAGATSFVPSAATNGSFLSGIHIAAADVGTNLLPAFVNLAVTTNHLALPELGPGTYCWMIQQTNAIVQSYSVEFVVTENGLPTARTTWGMVKDLYNR
jgi:hypothetical protein